MSMITDALHNYNLRYFHNIDPPTFTATYDGSVGANTYRYVATYVTINGETTQSAEVEVTLCDTLSANDYITLEAERIPAAARTIKYFRKVGNDYKYIGTSTVAVNALVDNGLTPTEAEPPLTNTSGRDGYHFIGYHTDRPLQRMELMDHQAMLHDQVKNIGDTTFVNGDIISGLTLHVVDAQAYEFTVDAGKMYFDGVVINIPASETLTLTGSDIETIGVLVESTVVTYEDDSKLRNLDDNIPIEYYNLPGADRISTSVTWAVNDDAAISIHEFENGIQKIRPLPLERTILTRSLANRTKDVSGDFVSRNFQTKTTEHPTDSTKFNITFGPGIAYVDGFRVDVPVSRSLAVDKARETDTVSGSKALTYESSGGYFVTQVGPYSVNGKSIKFKIGAGVSTTVTFSGTDPISSVSLVSQIVSALPWYTDPSYICQVLGLVPLEGVDNRNFMFAAPVGKYLTIESVSNAAYSELGITEGVYNTTGRKIYKLKKSSVKEVSDITGYRVEAISSVVRGSGASDYLDANLDDVIGVNYYGATADEKQGYCNDGMYGINKAGTVGALYVTEIATGGSGYQLNNEITVSDGFNGVLVVNSVDGSGAVTSASVKTGYSGYGYSTGIKATTGGSGSGCFIDVTSISAGTISADGTDIVFGGSGGPAQGTTYYVKYSKYITPVQGTRTKIRVTNGKVLKGAADGIDDIVLVSDVATTAHIITTGQSNQSTTAPTGSIRDIISMSSINSSVNGSGVEYTTATFITGANSQRIGQDKVDWSLCANSAALPDGQPDTGSYYYLSFDYWKHDVEGDYLTATSYHDYMAIPYAPNKEWQLRDCMDLRADGSKPFDGCNVFVDIEYYLPRVDKFVVTNDATFRVIKGAPGELPIAPKDVPSSLTLAVVKIPAYTYTHSDVSILSTEPLRVTQQGIREMQKRLDRVEYLLVTTQAESTTAIQEAAYNTSGMFTDPCVDDTRVNKGFNIGGIFHNAAFDQVNKCYRIPVDDVATFALVWDQDESTHFRLVQSADGSIICLDYQPVIISYQAMATDTININPNPIVNYLNGNVHLSPSGDMYFDTTQAPDHVSEINTNTQALLEYLAPDDLDVTDWGIWHYAGCNTPSAPAGSYTDVTAQTWWANRGTVTREEFYRMWRSGVNLDPTRWDPLGSWYLSDYYQSYTPSWPDTLTPVQYSFVTGTRVLDANGRWINARAEQWNYWRELQGLYALQQYGNVFNYYDEYGEVYSGRTEMPNYTYNSSDGLYHAVPPTAEAAYNSPEFEIAWRRYVEAAIASARQQGHAWAWGMAYDYTNTYDTSREGVRTQIVPERQEIDLGNQVIDLSSVPMMRIKDDNGNPFRIDVTASCLMPSAPHNVSIGGKSVNFLPGQGYSAGALFQSTYSTVLTDASGNLSGYFYMPSGIPSGVREVSVSHNSGADVSSGSALFTSQGLQTVTQDTTIGFTTSVIRRTDLCETGQVYSVGAGAYYIDPIGQTFVIDSPTYITAVGVYFATKPTSSNIPVACDIRKVVNGFITREVLASTSLYPDDITTSSDGTVETVFTFKDSQRFDASEYAIVLVTACQDYNVYIGTAGLPDLVSGARYNAQMHGGILFQSLNNSTWEPISASDLKFRIYKANFEPEGELVFQGISGVEAGVLSARVNQILGPGASASWYYQLASASAWIPFDPVVDQELDAIPTQVRLKVKVLNSGGTFQIALNGTTGIVLKNHKSGCNYVSKTIGFADKLSAPDELVLNMEMLANGTGSEYSGGTSIAPFYSTDGGNTWCEIYRDPTFSQRTISKEPFVDVRFRTPGEISIDNVTGTNGAPVVLTSLWHGYSNNQLVYVEENNAVNSQTLWMISDRTTDTFKLKNASTGAYLLSDGSTVSGGICYLATFDSLTLRVSLSTTAFPNSTVRSRTPLFKNIRAAANVTQ